MVLRLRILISKCAWHFTERRDQGEVEKVSFGATDDRNVAGSSERSRVQGVVVVDDNITTDHELLLLPGYFS